MTEFLTRLFFYNSTVLNSSETLRTCISSSVPQTKKKKNDRTEWIIFLAYYISGEKKSFLLKITFEERSLWETSNGINCRTW